MAVLTIFALVFLFIFGLVFTFPTKPTKKFTSFFQSQSSPTQNPPKNQPSSAMNSKGDLDSSSRTRTQELKTVFATFDKNKDGFITKQELSDSLNIIGISTSERDVIEMVQRVDVNGDGLIDFDEFCTLFESMMMMGREDDNREDHAHAHDHGDGDGDLKDAFDVFDGDRNGLISVEELGLVLDSLGFKEGKKFEDCKEMISKVDIDGDGMINFHEFKNMMKNGVSLVSVS